MVLLLKETLLKEELPKKGAGLWRPAAPGPFALMLLGSALCTMNNSLVHGVQLSLPALIQGRYLCQWLAGCTALAVRSWSQGVEFHPFGPPGTRLWLVLRGVVYFGFIWLWWLTLTLVPVGDAVAVVKCEVFVAGLASAMVFGERLTRRWWCCCCTSLLGVVLLVRPPFLFGGGDDVSTLGRVLNILTPIVGGTMPCLIKLARGAHFLEIQHCCDFICALVLSPPVLLLSGGSAAMLMPRTQLAVATVAVVGMTALCAFTLAYQSGAVGRVALVGYAEVPFAYIMQVAVFGAPLTATGLLGACLVVGSAVASSLEPPAEGGQQGQKAEACVSPLCTPVTEPPPFLQPEPLDLE